MSSKSIDYYLEKLNQIPPEVNQILHSIRKHDKEILKLQIDIDTKRQAVLQKIISYEQKKNAKIKSEIAQMLKNIQEIHQQMLRLTNQKITLSDKLYDCIDQTTEEMERDIGSNTPAENQSELKGPKSKRNKKDNEQQILASQPLYCTCQSRAFGKMVKCDNKSCDIQWFHMECVDEKQSNFNKQWFCKECRKNKVKTRRI